MEFRDLKRQYEKLKNDIDRNIAGVLDSARYISGPQVSLLEQKLAQYTGARHCISCGNGTDAISIALAAHGIGSGDAVFVPDFTFFSSGECPAAAGAVPVFVDVRPDTYNIDAASLEQAVDSVQAEGCLRPRAVVAVDLFGLPFDYDAIRRICKKYGMLLLEDGAQGFGGMYHGRRACSLGDISTVSFFPAKPLGCYGDGGAIFTNDDEIAGICRSLAVHGKHADDKYDNIRIGRNSRLDTLQAAVLLAKLQAFEEFELDAVNQAAGVYAGQLAGVPGLALPYVPDGCVSSWAQYTVQLPARACREAVRDFLKRDGVPSMVYYKKPMHRQGAFAGGRPARADCPVTEQLCSRVLCLPMHPYLTREEAVYAAGMLKKALRA